MASSKNVLILGCGLVAPPFIQYLNSHSVRLTIATRSLARADPIIATLEHPELVRVTKFDIESPEAMEELDVLTRSADLVVSLLPYVYHVQAAEIAIRYKKHFCTCSYVSDAMDALDQQAKDAGLTLLNECGVDPGLDHMSAMRVIDEVHKKGGKVRSFTSICGGLPAPEADDNPFGYKLSWAPRGVLLASKNSALYLKDGKEINVEGKDLFGAENVWPDKVEGAGDLEWYLNRDSVKYIDIYGIREALTLIRGTYRYQGKWCSVLKAIGDLNLNSVDNIDGLEDKTYAEACRVMLGIDAGVDAKQHIVDTLKLSAENDIISKLEWLGFFSADLTVPTGTDTALDAMCFLCKRSLVYKENEKDMIAMKHTFDVEYSPSHRERLTSTLIDFGQQDKPNGNSSMARTVCLPLAVAVRAILEGRITRTGVVRPVTPDVYNVILDEMEELGVKFTEEKEPVHLWLRGETKPGEERVPLTPEATAELIKAGVKVTVERSPHRCFADEAYEKVGATMAAFGSWPQAPYSAIIFGLKELPDEPRVLRHRHIFFAHCFKTQGGWEGVMKRFMDGGALLWDLEFLVDETGRRVAAFGRAAGVVGMAVGLLAWAAQHLNEEVPALSSWASAKEMVQQVRAKVDAAAKIAGHHPTSIVVGALGRCGSGAVWTAEQVGVEVSKWDLEETKAGGPFPAIMQHDVFVNCIYLRNKIPPFITKDMFEQSHKLSVLSDVSCDFTNPNNPVPVYSQETTLFNPILHVVPRGEGKTPFDVVCIDHLPSLIPSESSSDFCSDLMPSIRELVKDANAPVWQRAEDLFHTREKEVQQ